MSALMFDAPLTTSASSPLKSLLPTNKWIVTQITALAALLTAYVQVGAWNKELTIALIGLVSQALIGYIAPNASTPGGVRIKSP
jgi:hypothetical protein